MTEAETRHAIDPATTKTLDTDGLRVHFHVHVGRGSRRDR